MKTSTLAVLALGALATVPAWAQQSGSSGNRQPYPATTVERSTTLDSSTYLSPGEPLAAAETTQAYVPNSSVVLAVEQRLAQLNYPVTPDGQYDADLRNNVLRFQSDTGLRPTGDVDLATLGALGINVEPRGMVAQVPSTVVTEQTAQLPPSYDLPLLRSEHMSSPQVRRQSDPLETTTGLELNPSEIQVGEQPPGFPPGFPTEDLYQ